MTLRSNFNGRRVTNSQSEGHQPVTKALAEAHRIFQLI